MNNDRQGYCRKSGKTGKQSILFAWFIIAMGVIPLAAAGDYQKDYYPDNNLITVELAGRIVNYLECHRIPLVYPGLTGRCDVNMGSGTDGNTWAAISGAPRTEMKRLFYSHDGGWTWTSTLMAPTKNRNLVAFTALNNDNLLLVTNLANSSPHIYLSTDKGGNWNHTAALKPDPFQYIGEGFLSTTQLRNGKILLPIARFNDDPYETGIQGTVFISNDGGNTFPLVYLTFAYCMEAHILELQSGDLLGAFRHQRLRYPGETDAEILSQGGVIDLNTHDFNFKNVFLGDSHDGGKTWENLRPVKDRQGNALLWYGQCHGQLLQVPDGRVVLVYDNRYPNEERDVRAVASGDGGQTWDPVVYYVSFGRGDPASVVLEDGTIVTVTGNWPYGPTGPIGPPSAQAIRWKLPSGGNTGAIEILSPNSLSNWPPGSVQTLRWNSITGITSVKIRLYKGNSLSATIAASTANTGSFTWNIPVNLSPGSDYKINLTDAADSLLYGDSDRFSINSGPAISLNKTHLNFGAAGNGMNTRQQSVTIRNSGSGTLNWSTGCDAAWLSCSPASGKNNGMITAAVQPTGLTPGTYHAVITISDPLASNSPKTITVTLNVYNSNETSAPFGAYDTPLNGSTVYGSVPFTGWVLDDLEVQSVKLYRKEGGNLVYIGDGVFVEGARPDVEDAYPGYPLNSRAGWGYMMLTNMLPGGNGVFVIQANAVDLEGYQISLGTKTITVDNAHAVKPFGAIDTPAQGGTVSGSNYIDWGWVLTPQPNRIPLDGSTINVYIDGLNRGHPKYNISRRDIAALFPSYFNSNGAGGYFILDAGGYEDGVHTISWTVRDSGGNTDGIGSRYFSIQTTGTGSSGSLSRADSNASDRDIRDISQINGLPVDLSSPITVKRGFTEHAKPTSIFPDEKGNLNITLRELDRVVIHLADDPSRIEGFINSGNRLLPLPVGSTPEARTGNFSWQLGPGFTGVYRFIFIIKNREERVSRKNIVIRIIPKF